MVTASATASHKDVACPVCCRCFPSDAIERHVDACLGAQAEDVSNDDTCTAASGSKAQESDDGVLPTELLESLLDLELSEDAACYFWERYEQATKLNESSVREAFLIALEAVLVEDW